MHGLLAHISDTAALSNAAATTAIVVVFVVLALSALARHTKYRGVPNASARPLAQLAHRVAVIAGVIAGIIALGGVMLPSSGAGQQPGGALPDLISDPPRPAFLTEQTTEDGDRQLLLTFDGYVHNIGQGALDLSGNPQVPDGMVQKVLDGDTWREVSTPTVRYETDDGHNHFHLIEAIEYVLWDQAQGGQTAIGSKIGFCLVDSEQREPGVDAFYSEEKDNFCEEDNPGATSLRMGISPGWRDIYDATTTLQWVNVSDLAPGRYWIGAITDPNDEIVESNEDNNALIFADVPAIVPGWLPDDSAVTSDGNAATLEFDVEAFGTVTEPVFVIEQGPTSGRVDVPAGAAVGGTVTYIPDEGFVGRDEIVFSVRDAQSQFPTVAPRATITIEVQAAATAAGAPDAGIAPALLTESTFFELTSGEIFSSAIQADSISGDPPTLFAIDLPPGVRLDRATSALTGVATRAGIFESEIVAVGDMANPDATTTRQPISFIVTEGTDPGLYAQSAKSSPLQRELQLQLGRPGLGYRYEATGLPPGLLIEETAPVVIGTPTEVGAFDVELRHFEPTAPDDVARVERFTWVIRPAVAISFAL